MGSESGTNTQDGARAAAEFAPDRWARLAAPLDVDPAAPVAIALSGGADSVYLLRLVHAAVPRPRIVGVHVAHALRGADSAADAAFCRATCAELGVGYDERPAPVDPRPAGLEARAREARYRALAAAARAHGIGCIATAHHADDALETLLLRWLRGTELLGLAALRRRRELVARDFDPLDGAPACEPLVVVRPLLALRRAEIRAALRSAGVDWREDASNADPRFARNALREEFLPALVRAAGPAALVNLHAFGSAVADLEAALAARTPPLPLAPPRHAAARRSARTVRLGGSVPRAALVVLERPLARRALARLCSESIGAVPRRAALDALLDDLYAGRTGTHVVSGGGRLHLRGDRLDDAPPARRAGDPRQLAFGFAREWAGDRRALAVPGALDLGDGRRIEAERAVVPAGTPFPTDPLAVELDARGLAAPLGVRFALPGDRFHALGARGSKPLVRFLADAGVPREDRGRVPLVVAGDEIVWVAGLRPAHARRVRADTPERIRLRLVLGPDGSGGGADRAR